MPFPFLSDEWMAAARAIRAEYADQEPAIPLEVRMNMVVKDVPFGDGQVDAHLDTSTGTLDLELGHVEKPDLSLTLGYDTARAILVDGDTTAAMNAFMSGRIKVDGDITKMIALQSSGALGGGGPAAAEMARRLIAITE
ncbi:MAG: SCP2 sterol-binding domain-containing protein [Acidimicrobiaceae bacterium]|nr:SCP2 sterol-binding domain-containing protein [Acidimicrobiaceae bacterium]